MGDVWHQGDTEQRQVTPPFSMCMGEKKSKTRSLAGVWSASTAFMQDEQTRIRPKEGRKSDTQEQNSVGELKENGPEQCVEGKWEK